MIALSKVHCPASRYKTQIYEYHDGKILPELLLKSVQQVFASVLHKVVRCHHYGYNNLSQVKFNVECVQQPAK